VEEIHIEHHSSITHYSLEHLQALRSRLDAKKHLLQLELCQQLLMPALANLDNIRFMILYNIIIIDFYNVLRLSGGVDVACDQYLDDILGSQTVSTADPYMGTWVHGGRGQSRGKGPLG
jgi:hypothetical protein